MRIVKSFTSRSFKLLCLVIFLPKSKAGPSSFGNTTIKDISAGGRHTCAILINHSLKCWGWNEYGQLGQGDMINRGDGVIPMNELLHIDLGKNHKVEHVSAGNSHTCVILDDESLKCWGWNKYGQLGLENRKKNRGVDPLDMGTNLPTFAFADKVKRISAGHSQTCATLKNDVLICWGQVWDVNEQLSGSMSAVSNTKKFEGMDEANFLPKEIRINDVVREVVLGDSHACAILVNSNSLRCWGWNRYGQLGLEDIVYRGISEEDLGQNATVDLGSDNLTNKKIEQVSLGYAHTCAVVNEKVKCWGWNFDGQLGYGDIDNRGDLPHQMGDNLPFVDVGLNARVKQISLGHYHTCAIIINKGLKCWGFNNNGQLGYGDQLNRGNEINSMGDNLPVLDLGSDKKADKVSAGFSHTCVLLDDTSIKCWGLNDKGQLGLGDILNRGSIKGYMGDKLPKVDLISDALIHKTQLPTLSPTGKESYLFENRNQSIHGAFMDDIDDDDDDDYIDVIYEDINTFRKSWDTSQVTDISLTLKFGAVSIFVFVWLLLTL